MRRKKGNILHLLLMSFLILGLCSMSIQARELIFATTMDDSGIDRALTQKFAELVEEYSNGSLTVQLFMGGVLGGEREAIEQLQMGEIDVGYNSITGSLYYQEYDATTIPFLFPSPEVADTFFLSASWEEAMNRTKQQGNLVYLGAQHTYGSRWTTTNRPFSNPEELRGLKIRMPNLPVWIEVWEAMGASPTPVAAPEILSALRTGVVDAQENFLTNIHGRAMWEVQKYVVATKHIDFYQIWFASEMTWMSLTEEEQKALSQAAIDAVEYVKPQIEAMNNEFIAAFAENGMELIEPDREALMEAARPAIMRIIDETLAPEVREEVLELVGWN